MKMPDFALRPISSREISGKCSVILVTCLIFEKKLQEGKLMFLEHFKQSFKTSMIEFIIIYQDEKVSGFHQWAQQKLD